MRTVRSSARAPVKRGVDEKTANDIFNDMSSFASYAFNKSHAAAYAFVAYTTAWLKCHYPCEFMAALISSVLDDTPKVAEYIAECSRLGIEVVPAPMSMSAPSVSLQRTERYISACSP